MTRNIILAALLCSIPAVAVAQEGTPTVFNTKDTPLTPAERDALRISQEWQERSATGIRPVAGAEGSVVFLFGATEPSIVCAVLQICDVQLQAGEQVNSINVGDSARWLIEPAVSNSGPNETQHLIIKPMDVGLSTSLVVTTDRRTYHIKLSSTRYEFMARVAFQYPDDVNAKWAALKAHNEVVRNERTIAVPGGATAAYAGGAGRPAAEYLSNLSFNYSVKGRARWKPVRVFNDGVKTIIEMPRAMEQTEAPSLLVVRAGGSVKKAEDTSIVNYRLQGDRYIVDQIFDEAVMIAGVGKRQDRVTIVREQ
jgi:P-type conjugative transfer protein TrbG